MTYIAPPRQIKWLKKVKPKSTRARWQDEAGNIYEWDGRHGMLEKYDSRGKHLGEYNIFGNQTKEPDPKRTIEP